MKENNVYEVGFLLNPDLSQQEAEASTAKVKKLLADQGASVMSEGEVVNIELAYQIITKIKAQNERFDKAYFSWVKFSISEPALVEKIKAELDKIKSEVFRYLITKTVAEDDLTNKFALPIEEEEPEPEAETVDPVVDEEKPEPKEETKVEVEEAKEK